MEVMKLATVEKCRKPEIFGRKQELSLGLAFRNICSQLPREAFSNCLPTWFDFEVYSKFEVFKGKDKDNQELLSSSNLQQALNCLKQLSSYYQFDEMSLC